MVLETNQKETDGEGFTVKDGVKILTEKAITDVELEAMSQDDIFACITEYRKEIAKGSKLDEQTHSNAVRLLRQSRHRSIAANPRASKKAKAAVAKKFDLGKFIPNANGS